MVEEKISLTAGRDGGLQNMEVHGMLRLRVNQEKAARVKVLLSNNDQKGIQLQVCFPCSKLVKSEDTQD